MCKTPLIKVLAIGLLCGAALAARAGSYTNTFNSESSTNAIDFAGSLWDGVTLAHTGSSAYIPTGGAGPIGNTANGPVLGVTGDGYLQLTFAAITCGAGFSASSYMCGGVLFSNFDPGEIVAGFTFECDLRIGNGNASPADGFSINYCRNSDPVLTALAAGDTFPGMNNAISANGGQFRDNGSSGDTSLMEEGTSTGLAIGFDMWDSGNYTIPPNSPAIGKVAAGLTHDNIGLDISVDDVLQTTIAMPNGTAQTTYTSSGSAITQSDTDGSTAANDPLAIETGPYDDTGCANVLSWCHFKVFLNPTNQTLSVWWKTNLVLNNFAVNYLPSPGRLIMAARVGGNEANIGVDNIQLTTYATSHLLIGNAQINAIGASVQINPNGTSVPDTNTVVLEVNGKDVTPTSITEATNGLVTVSWSDAATPFTAGSTQNLTLTVNDTLKNGPYTYSTPLTVGSYLMATKAMAVPSVDTTQLGFNVAPYHLTANPLLSSYLSTPALQIAENSLRRAEEEQAGLLGANDAKVTTYTESGVINYSDNTNAAEGVWSVNNSHPDKPFPGMSDNSATDEPQIDNYTAEITTYVYFPETGLYVLSFNADDGETTSIGNPANDRFNAVTLTQQDGGNGATTQSGQIYVPEAGYYPLRALYYQGGGGAGAEWSGYEIAPTATTNALINDPLSPTALKAYRVATGTHSYPAAVTFIDPVVSSPSASAYDPTWALTAKITDGSDGAISAAAAYLNGAKLSSATATKSGAVTTLAYTPASMSQWYASGSANVMGVVFTDGSGSVHSNIVNFNVRSYTVVPASMALSTSSVTTANTGFDVYPNYYQGFVGSVNAYGVPTHTWESEVQDHGFLGWPNAADFTVNWVFSGPGNTNYIEQNVVSYNGASGQNGPFLQNSGSGANMPGIPPQVWPSYNGSPVKDSDGNNDYYTEDVKTVIYLTPGWYNMVVNSDDGFSVSVGNPAEWSTFRMVLGQYDGGRGTSSSPIFPFYITTAGYYPFTCLYYEGGGGNALTWANTTPYPFYTLALINDATAQIQVGNTYPNPAMVPSYQYPFGKTQGSPYTASYGPAMFRGNDTINGYAHSTHAGYDAPVWANLVDGDTAITTSSIYLWVNGSAVAPTISKAGNTTTVKYQPAVNWTPGTTNTVTLVYLDRTNTWSFMVENHPNATFFIEAEDVDSGGKGVPAASVMPYFGGAYAGLPATLNVDYFRANQTDGPWYRVASNSSVSNAAPLNPNIPMQFNEDLDRGVNEVQCNYRIGWIGSGQWYNYTRNFPAGSYNVYAGISNGSGAGTGAHDRYAVLQAVNATTTNNVGVFDSVATGSWGQNGGVGQAGGVGLVPLTDPNGNMVSLALGGPQTLRYWLPASGATATIAGVSTTLQNGSGDWDFMLFTPAVGQKSAPTLSISEVSGKIVITYTGTLSASAFVEGPYADVAGAASPYTVPSATGSTMFFRTHD